MHLDLDQDMTPGLILTSPGVADLKSRGGKGKMLHQVNKAM